MMFGFLSALRLSPLAAKFALAGLVAFLLLLFGLWLAARENADDKHNQDVGAAVQRADDLQETLGRIEKGNAKRDEVTAEAGVGRGSELYAQCLRTARTPANCERFLP